MLSSALNSDLHARFKQPRSQHLRLLAYSSPLEAQAQTAGALFARCSPSSRCRQKGKCTTIRAWYLAIVTTLTGAKVQPHLRQCQDQRRVPPTVARPSHVSAWE